MLKIYTWGVSALLLALGLWGFLRGTLPGVVQLDLFQSLVYVSLGGVGLKLGFGSSTPKTLSHYVTATGIMGLVFLGFGLTWANFFDLFHLEIPEHVFHAVIGVAGCLVGSRKQPNV